MIGRSFSCELIARGRGGGGCSTRSGVNADEEVAKLRARVRVLRVWVLEREDKMNNACGDFWEIFLR